MFYRQDFHALGRDGGGQARVGHCSCGDRYFNRMAQINASENYSSVRGRRTQTQLYPLAAVQANADRAGKGLQGSLFEHV